jgi:signal transduction histidine kinase
MNELLEMKVQEKIEILIQQEKLITTQSKQAVMGEMISMIAHQWRQPLSSVTLRISNLQLKRMLGEEVGEKEIEETLTSINETVVYLAQTIDDFQTYFRPNKEKQVVEVQELIRKVVTFIRPRMKETHIELIILETESFSFETYINEAVQVILNLLNNAVDALVVSTKERKRITILLENMPQSVKIVISDTADGISEENIKHIFEPYFSTKGKNGTGLGLYMSQMIMQKQFDSEISVQSSHEGTTFELTFPK